MPNREALQPAGLAIPKSPYSSVIVSGDLVFTAGQAPFDSDGNLVSDDFAEQTHQTLRNLRSCLEAAGCRVSDVLKVTAYIVDPADFATFNEIYQQYFTEPYPARATLVTNLLGFKVEIEAIARKP
ncbi:RidA family protein [Nocardia sp. NBC_01009]|uniref:RidA family protein n=1 Tax=Nocardia sp. NBC_01009 TaxID=2975996 RepID=UPI003865860B|nr:RidA family protein [Nocardia sp. NBC_01009]